MRGLASTVLISAAIGLSACSTGNAVTGDGATVRQSVVTAPADLQLLCSAETARKYGLDRNDVLPVESDAMSPQVYRVVVQSGNQSFRCVVDRNAKIFEIVRT